MKKPAIGIDLGTTYSVVAVCHPDGKVEIIPDGTGNRIMPSVVAFTNKEILVGKAAVSQAINNSENTIYGVKRLIGREMMDPTVSVNLDSSPITIIERENKVKIEVKYQEREHSFFPEQISAMILERLKKTAEEYLKETVKDVVITVPAYFNNGQRMATMDAAKIAGLNVLRIINEPTAAALAYGEKTKDETGERNILVYDFGGGTFDVSIVTIKGNDYKVRGTTGDTHLGGEDIDNHMVEHFLQEFETIHESDTRNDKILMRTLKDYCENAKRTLSSTDRTSFILDGLNFITKINRAKFEQLNMDLFEKTFELVDEVLEKTSLTKNEIDDVFLVGGSSRIPYIRNMVEEYFNIQHLKPVVNPDEAVAYGAAIQAAILLNGDLNKSRKIKLADVCPLSLGVKMSSGKMAVIIPRNTPIPTKKSKTFHTVIDDQPSIINRIYEGESYLVQGNHFLGEFVIDNIPKGRAGTVEEICTFEIDSDGILTVTAFEPSTKKSAQIVIKNESRLSKEELKKVSREAAKIRKSNENVNKQIQALNDFERFLLKKKRQFKEFDSPDIIVVIDYFLRWFDENKETATEKDLEGQKKKFKTALLDASLIHKNRKKLPKKLQINNKPVIGIDLGTTNSVVVAVFYDGHVEVLLNDQGNRHIPSVVTFTETERLIGEAAEYHAAENPKNTIYGVKRLIGRRIDDPKIQKDLNTWPFTVVEENGYVKVEVEYKGEMKRFLPEQISSMILEKMKKIAEYYLETKVTDAVITVPAYFNNAQREATKDAAKIAGLNVIRIINEPTAAAIAFGLKTQAGKPRTVLVYDFGGGTFDVSIIKIDDKDYHVIAVSGNTHLGGEDINMRMVEHFIHEFKSDGIDISNDISLVQNLRKHCEKVKKTLSYANEATFTLDGNQLTATLTRARFEDINEDFFASTIKFVEKALQDAKLEKKDIDDILLVGGSSRIPRVQELLQEFFDGKALNKGINPDECVAIGAAIEAASRSKLANLPPRMSLKLHDVCPLSLGVELDDGRMNVLIKRNTGIPFKMSKFFRPAREEATEIDVKIYEGERFLCKNNNFLGELKLVGINDLSSGGGVIEIRFEIDESGIMHVTTIEPTTKIENDIKILQKGQLGKIYYEKAVEDAQKMRQEEEMHRVRLDAWNDLEKFLWEIRRHAKKKALSNDISEADKEEVLKECTVMNKWLNINHFATKDELDEKKVEMEEFWEQIINH